MQNIAERFVIMVLMIWIALNIVSFGMMFNGSANRWNPVWGFFGGFLELEWTIVKFLLVAALAAAVIFVVMWIFVNVTKEPKKAEEIYYSRSTYEESREPRFEQPEPHPSEKPPPEKSYTIPASELHVKKPEPEPRELTPEELKQKAI